MTSYGSVPRALSNDVEDNKRYQAKVDNSDGESNIPDKKAAISFVGALLLATVVALLGFAGYSSFASITSTSSSSKPMFYEYEETSNPPMLNEDDLNIFATNEYGHFTGPYPWMETSPGMQLVEPYKDSTLTLRGNYVDAGIYKFNWIIEDYDTTEWSTDATTQTAVFKTPGFLNVRIQVLDSSDNVVAKYTTVFVVKYVKRELRTLTVEDRERFLNAMATLWQYGQAEGEAKYGEKYTSIQSLVAAHSLASNDMMCDQYHEGSGFITHHLALALVFEESLRTVDPSVTVPYWDFTIEGQQISDLGEKPSYLTKLTPVFTNEWFGSVDEMNHIADSRWGHAAMPRQTDDTSSVRNSYGYIRSYWNNNPDPEISRKLFYACGVEPEHKKIPTCKNHYDVLNSATLGDFQILSPADGHGPMHVQIGGMWGGCEEAYANFTRKWGELLNSDMSNEEILAAGYKKWKWGNKAPRALMVNTAIMGEYFHIYRSMWRSHMCAVDGTPALLECPDECDEDVPFEECKCQVTKLVTGETTWENLFPCVLNSAENQRYFQSTMPVDMIKDLTYMLATSSVQEGEMIESASTADPMFWLIHPAIERLLQAKRLPTVTNMGGTEFYKWPIVDGSNETWLEYSYYSFDEGENPYYSDAYTCYGHGANDKVLPSADFYYTDTASKYADQDGDGIVTNWEFFLTLDPNNPDYSDYVFDNFDWDHCDDADL